MPITIDELSRILGLSPSTVSKALNGRSDVAATTRDRVLQTALEVGYQPSAAARNLRRQRTDKIGLVFTYSIDIVKDFLSELLPSMAAAAEQAEYNLILYLADTDCQNQIARLCQSREVDGIILLWPPDLPQTLDLVDLMRSENMPHIVLPRRLPHPDIAYVAADHITGARLLTQHLIGLGHRRIAFVGMPELHQTHDDRLSGYRGALADAGLPEDPALITDVDCTVETDAGEAFHAFLNLPDPPTAILFFTDPMAIRILADAARRGLHIPADLSIAGYDGILTSGVTVPALTTVRQPLQQMGCAALAGLLSQLNEPDAPAPQQVLPVKLLARASTGPPRQHTLTDQQRQFSHG